MKLQHKIAGTILLPLAAAAMTTSVQAADVDVYGRIQIHVTETTPDGGDMDFSAGGTESRLGFIAKNDSGAKAHIEFDLNGSYKTDGDTTATTTVSKASTVKTGEPRLRHAYVTFDGVTVGQTWKPSATTELLFPALDPNTNALSSAPSTRAAQVSTKMDLGAGSLTVGAYDAGVTDSAVPGLAAKFVGDMGGLKVVGAFDMTQDAGDNSTDGSTRITGGVVADMSGMTVKGSFTTHSDLYTAFGGSVSLPMGDGMSFNAAFDQYSPDAAGKDDATAIWANVKTTTASGVTVGAEYSMLGAGYGFAAAPAVDTSTIRFMANYNF
ncbi:hypothetical protein [Oceanospirillum sanctuarii]|uniref:hypothetical protein n=1 Tax=Oceanospirillum sanctuarii TaxID=1434821 RepID=UPI000A396E47|nr:hypothetical protein [Oceanospirillum sanctuarii]